MIATTTMARIVAPALLFLLSLLHLSFAGQWLSTQRPFIPLDEGPPPPPSIDTFKEVQLSHTGIYMGSILSKNAPPFISLYVKQPLFDVNTVEVRAQKVTRRGWYDVNLGCGGLETGGVEACEKDDIKKASSSSASSMSSQPEDCKPYKIIESQWRLLFTAESCPALAPLLDSKSATNESSLVSTTLSFDIQRVFPARREKHHFWLASLQRGSDDADDIDGPAKWPLAGTAHGGRDSTSERYTGKTPNRIAGLMQDPYIPKAAKPSSGDPLNGVDIGAVSWDYGISIEVPNNGNSSDGPTGPPLEPVHAPVSGQIVYVGQYRLARMPDNHRNDERGWGIMIRDEWGFVFQLLGLDGDSLRFQEGDSVGKGELVGGASRTLLSGEPPCRHKPADPPKMDDKSRRYPFRRRLLRLMVARPDPSWHSWKGFYESGWQYYNPLDAMTWGKFTSVVPPDANPTSLFFAKPSEDRGLTPPSIQSTTKDFFAVTLSGKVEIIIGFDAFQATPLEASDQMDPLAIHALEWSAWPRIGESPGSSPSISRGTGGAHAFKGDSKQCGDKPQDVEWRSSFEHAKLPFHWSTPLPKNGLLAHYVPAFTVGTVPFLKTSYASQFDEKSRKLYFAPTRSLLGAPDGRGAWDTTKEPEGNGVYEVMVRARDWWGNEGCFGSLVTIRN